MIIKLANPSERFAQSTGAVEYTDFIFAGGLDTLPNECPWYDT